jgi:hypothetical protein
MAAPRWKDVRDIFVSDAWAQATSAADDAQNPANHAGKILCLNDNGTVPKDNPFVGRPGVRWRSTRSAFAMRLGFSSTRRPV